MPSLQDFDNFLMQQNQGPSELGTPQVMPSSGQDIHSLINDVSLQEGVDPDLIKALVKHESNFNPSAQAPTSTAKGLMQLVDGTARDMGVQDSMNPEQNLRGGIKYLKQHLQKTGGNIPQALAMYNQGPAGDLSKASDYVNKIMGTYGKGDYSPISVSPSQPVQHEQPLFSGPDELSQFVSSYYPPKESIVEKIGKLNPEFGQGSVEGTQELAGLAGRTVGKAFTDSISTPPVQVGQLPFGVENKGDKLSQIAKDVVYGIPEAITTLGAGAVGFPVGQIAGAGQIDPTNLTESMANAYDVAEKVSSTSMGTPKTATGQLLMKPIEVVFGTILGTVGNFVKEMNPDASPQELETKTKAAQYVTNTLLLGLPLAAKKFNSSVRLTPDEMATYKSPEVLEAAKEQVKNDPQVSAEVKAQVDGVDVGVIDSIEGKIAKAQAQGRVSKQGGMAAKVDTNQVIVDELLTEAELREGQGKSSMKKAARIVADLEVDASGVDFKEVKGIKVGGSTGKVIQRVLEEREVQRISEEKLAEGTGEDVPLDVGEKVAPVADLAKVEEPIPPVEVAPTIEAPVVKSPQEIATEVSPTLKYDGEMKGIPEMGIESIHGFTEVLPDGRQPPFSVAGELTPEKIQKAREEVLGKFETKIEDSVLPKEEVIIPEFTNTKLAKGEGYTFPDNSRYGTVEAAQKRASELGEGHEVVKVSGKYKVGKIEENVFKEFDSPEAANAGGWEVMSELSERQAKGETPSEGFAIGKVGDKYFRLSEKKEMPREVIPEEVKSTDLFEDEVSPEDWALLKSFTDEATWREVTSRNELQESLSQRKQSTPETVDVSNAQAADMFQKWRDSYVTKCDVAQEVSVKAEKQGKKSKVTKEDLSLVDDAFKEFPSREACEQYMERNGIVGEVIEDPLTGKASYLADDRFKLLDEVDPYDEITERLEANRNYEDGEFYSKSKGGIKVLEGDGQLYNRLVQATTSREAIQIVREYVDNQSVQAMIIDRLLPQIKDIPFTLTNDPKNSRIGYAKIKFPDANITGIYNGRDITIVGMEHPDIRVNINTVAGSVVHEVVHSMLSKGIEHGIKERKFYMNTPAATLVSELNRVYKQVKNSTEHMYGLTDLHEFASEALSNKEFQEVLKYKSDPEGTSLLTRFANSVKKFLGLEEVESNAFLRTLDIVGKYLDETGHQGKLDSNMSDGGKLGMLDFLKNERGSVDITPLRGTVDLLETTMREAKKLAMSVDDYLTSIGTDPLVIEVMKNAIGRLPAMKQELKDRDPVTEAIFRPEGPLAAKQTVKKNKNGKVIHSMPPITQALADKAINANKDFLHGKTVSHVDPITGKYKASFNTHSYQRLLNGFKNPIYSLEMAGLKELRHMERQSAALAKVDETNWNTWIDKVEGTVSKERRDNYAIDSYARMKGAYEYFQEKGLSKQFELTPEEIKTKTEIAKVMDAMLDRINYNRVRSGEKAIPPLLDMDGNRNYLPVIRAVNIAAELGTLEGLHTMPLDKLNSMVQDFKGSFNPHALKRKVSSIPIELDPFTALRKYGRYAFRDIHMAPIAALCHELATVKLKIPEHQGKMSIAEWNPALGNLLLNYSDQILGKDPVLAAITAKHSWMGSALHGSDSISARLVAGIIGGSARTFAVQPSMYLPNTLKLSLASSGYGVMKLMADIGKGKESRYWKESNVANLREYGNDFAHMKELMDRGVFEGNRRKAVELVMKPTGYMDAVVAEASWNAGMWYAEKNLKLKGKEAINFADDFVEKSQGLPTRGSIAPVQASAVTRVFTILQSFGISDFNFITHEILGIKNPNMSKMDVLMTGTKYVIGLAIMGELYKYAGLENVVPDPVGAYQEAKKKGTGNTRALYMASLEFLEKVPILSNIKYASNLGGPLAEMGDMIPEALKAAGSLTDWGRMSEKQRRNNIMLMTRAAGYWYGIPMTNQILKSVKSAYNGGNPYQIIMGVYDKEKAAMMNKKGGLRPEIPKPHIPKPF